MRNSIFDHTFFKSVFEFILNPVLITLFLKVYYMADNSFQNSVLKFVHSFNKYTTTDHYIKIYWTIYLLIAAVSYGLQIMNDYLYCGILAEIIRFTHQLFFPIIFIGMLAPINQLKYVVIILVLSLASWIFTSKNYCILTMFENYLCNLPLDKRFKTLLNYAFSKETNLKIRHVRIYFVSFMVIFIALRLYDHYNTH